MTRKSEAKILRPGTRVTVGGREVTVLPLTLDQLIDSTEALTSIASGVDSETGWPTLLKKHRKEIYSFIAASSSISVDEIGKLPASEAWSLLSAFFEENKSFFVDQLIPLIKDTLAAVAQLESAGQTSSENLGSTDTSGQPAES